MIWPAKLGTRTRATGTNRSNPSKILVHVKLSKRLLMELRSQTQTTLKEQEAFADSTFKDWPVERLADLPEKPYLVEPAMSPHPTKLRTKFRYSPMSPPTVKLESSP